jgi:hypothetical protein
MTPEEREEFLRKRLAAVQEMMGGMDPAVGRALEQQVRNLLSAGGAGEQLLGMVGGMQDLVGAMTGAMAGTTAGDKYLTHRGDIKAAVGVGGALAFVTAHPEGQPTALYRLDADSLKLSEQALPCGGVALAADGEFLYLAGTDRRVYVSDAGRVPKPLGGPHAAEVVALVPVSGDRLADRRRVSRRRSGAANTRPTRSRNVPRRGPDRAVARGRHREGDGRCLRRPGQGRVRAV